jgi:hypothetical protein
VNITKPLIVSVIGLSLVAGCKGVNPPSRGRADVTEHNKVFFSQEQKERLRESTAILGDRVDRDQFGLLTVVVPIRSAVSRTLYLEYQYERTSRRRPDRLAAHHPRSRLAGHDPVHQHQPPGGRLPLHDPLRAVRRRAQVVMLRYPEASA